MSNGSDIAAEIAQALADVAGDTGAGSFVATVTRAPADKPTTPWGAASTTPPTTYSVNVIRDSWNRFEIDGTKIMATDLKLMMQAGVVVPTTADKITVSGKQHNILSVMPEAVGGVDLYYIVQARA